MNRILKISRQVIALTFGVALVSASALAADRGLRISAPEQASAGTRVQVAVAADTDAGGSEQIGFLQVEYSVDGGDTWIVVCYDENVGAKVSRVVDLQVGQAGTETILRARVAFRGGVAGDVDVEGNKIKWDTTWSTWKAPSARQAVIVVK